MGQRIHAEGAESRSARADVQLEAAIERLLAARAARQLAGRTSSGRRWPTRSSTNGEHAAGNGGG
jgi:hypothetical protein